MRIYDNISQLVGKTPLVRLSRLFPEGNVLAKLEYFNPAGSSKDRVALSMIDDAEKKGLLRPDSVIIEPTSGNTGIGLAAIGVSRGYRVILTMPDTMSVERRRLLSSYGAEIVLTDGTLGMNGAVKKAEELRDSLPHSVIMGQFDNPANPEAHYTTTAREIWQDTDGKIDVFLCGVGTGGTFSGVGRYLKEKDPAIKLIALEPDFSPMISEGRSGSHGIQGIGANFVPKNYDASLCDEVIRIADPDAFEYAKKAARAEGLLVGISSGAALKGAEIIASRDEFKNKTIVALLPDSGERYLSTGVFD